MIKRVDKNNLFSRHGILFVAVQQWADSGTPQRIRPVMAKKVATPTQTVRNTKMAIIFDQLDGMVIGSKKRGNAVRKLATRLRLAYGVVNKYYNAEKARREALEYPYGGTVMNGYEMSVRNAPDVEAPDVEAPDVVSDFIGKLSSDEPGFDFAPEATLDSQTTFNIEQSDDGTIRLTMTVTITPDRLKEFMLGLI
jgi:hypothetical protein